MSIGEKELRNNSVKVIKNTNDFFKTKIVKVEKVKVKVDLVEIVEKLTITIDSLVDFCVLRGFKRIISNKKIIDKIKSKIKK